MQYLEIFIMYYKNERGREGTLPSSLWRQHQRWTCFCVVMFKITRTIRTTNEKLLFFNSYSLDGKSRIAKNSTRGKYRWKSNHLCSSSFRSTTLGNGEIARVREWVEGGGGWVKERFYHEKYAPKLFFVLQNLASSVISLFILVVLN